MAENKQKKKLYQKLWNKYRLVIMNDNTFEEKASLKLSPINVFVFFGTIVLTLVTGMIYLIAFTPLREYIPGYAADINNQSMVMNMNLKADSLEKELDARDKFIKNLQNVLNGNVGDDTAHNKKDVTPLKYDTIKSLPISKEDSQLRMQFENEGNYDLAVTENNNKADNINSFLFFTPLKGTITNIFDPLGKHFGIDIVAPKNEAVKATLDGTVIFSSWTVETGYVIIIQHANNLISVYKLYL